MSERIKSVWADILKAFLGGLFSAIVAIFTVGFYAGDAVSELHATTASVAKAHVDIKRLDDEGTKALREIRAREEEKRISDERRMAAVEAAAASIPKMQTDIEWIRRRLEREEDKR